MKVRIYDPILKGLDVRFPYHEQEVELGFKLVTNNLQSLSYGAATTTYPPGVVVPPPPNCGPITVFDSIEAVINFCGEHGWLYGPYGPRLWVVGFVPDPLDEKHKRFPSDSGFLWNPHHAIETPLPDGTRLASSVCLIRELHWPLFKHQGEDK